MKVLWLYGLLAMSLAPAAMAAEQPKKETCRVMPGREVKEKFFADHDGQRFYFCCRPCVKSFKRNPAKYLS
jgi:YHS domain-containing protein